MINKPPSEIHGLWLRATFYLNFKGGQGWRQAWPGGGSYSHASADWPRANKIPFALREGFEDPGGVSINHMPGLYGKVAGATCNFPIEMEIPPK